MTANRQEEAGRRQPKGQRRQRGQTAAEFINKYDPAEEVKHLRERVKDLEAQHEDYEKSVGGLRVLFAELRDIIGDMDPPKLEYKKPSDGRVSTPVTYVSHWTDWHNGAVQDPDEVEGFNAFNPDILRKRLHNNIQDQLAWVDLHRKSYDISTSRDLVTGDLISGDIHQELLITNAYPSPVQAIKAGELLAEIIALKSPHFEKVIVDFVTVDNHSRLTKKPQAGEGGMNTWNYVVGFYAKERLRNFSNVEFNIHEVMQQLVDIDGRRYLLMHGHQIRGWMGIPFYGWQRRVGKEAIKRMRRRLSGFDRIIAGHFHTPMTTPHFWLGGSACGTMAYDHQEGREADPSQSSWLVHPVHGEFDRVDWTLGDN